MCWIIQSARNLGAQAGIWTRVQRATAANTIPAGEKTHAETGLYYLGYQWRKVPIE